MRQLCENGIYVFYQTENAQLLLGDTFELLQKLRPESVDVIFADPPYFLSNNGITCRSGKMVSVNKAAWDMVDDKEHMLANKHQFNRRWINLCKKVLKPNGTIWISGTFHNIFSIGMALEEEGFRIINNITWLIRRQILPAVALRILRKQSSGLARMIKKQNTFLTMP